MPLVHGGGIEKDGGFGLFYLNIFQIAHTSYLGNIVSEGQVGGK